MSRPAPAPDRTWVTEIDPALKSRKDELVQVLSSKHGKDGPS